MSTTTPQTLDGLAAIIGSKVENSRQEAMDAYLKTKEAHPNVDDKAHSDLSGVELWSPYDQDAPHPAWLYYPCDMPLDTHGPLLSKPPVIVSFGEYSDVGKLSVMEAIEHAFAQLFEGAGKVRAANRRMYAAWGKLNLQLEAQGQSKVSWEDFQAAQIGAYLAMKKLDIVDGQLRRKATKGGVRRQALSPVPQGTGAKSASLREGDFISPT